MVIPELVNEKGEFLSYHVQHDYYRHLLHQQASTRRRRQAANLTSRREQRRLKRPKAMLPRGFAEAGPDRVFYKLSAFGRIFQFNLTLNTNLFSKSFRSERWVGNGPKKTSNKVHHCHYTGFSKEPNKSNRAAISNCIGLVSFMDLVGFF